MDFIRTVQRLGFRQASLTHPPHARHILSHLSRKPPQELQRCLRQQQRNFFIARKPIPTTTQFAASRHNLVRTFRRFQSSFPSASTPPENLTLAQRMRKLSREYGYAALGVYLGLTALDLPFCYMAVSYLGADRIGRWEHAIMSYIKEMVKWPMGASGQEKVDEGVNWVKSKVPIEEVTRSEDGETGEPKRLLEEDETWVIEDHGFKEAEAADRGANAGFWTKFALAYAIHKSFIFVRVPLTAAITPKVVKTLRGWGWKIGKRPTLRSSAKPSPNSKGTGVNSGKTGINSD